MVPEGPCHSMRNDVIYTRGTAASEYVLTLSHTIENYPTKGAVSQNVRGRESEANPRG